MLIYQPIYDILELSYRYGEGFYSMIDAIKKYKYNYLILLILPFVVFMVGPNVILKMGVHSDYTIWTGDALAQMMPYVTYFRDHGFDLSAFTYNANYGVGTEMYGTFFYYLSSPILWLIFLFPKSWLFNVVWVLAIIRYGIGGITFHTWLTRHYKNINTKVLLLLSLAFIFSGYFIFSFAFYQWLDFLFIIPLMMMGLDRIMNRGSIWLFTGSMIYMVVSNFYIAYMLVLFSVFYVIYMLTVNKEWSILTVKDLLMRYVVSGVLTFVATLPVLFIIINSMMNSRLSGAADTANSIGWLDQNLSIIRFIGKFQLGSHSYQEVYDGHPIVWIATGFLIMYILAFFHRDVAKRVKMTNAAFFAALLVLSSTHISYLLIHAGSLPNGLPFRHSFLFNLLFLFMLAEFFNTVSPWRLFDYKNAYLVSKKTLMLIMLFIGIVFGVCYFLSNTAYPIFSIISIALYFLYFILLFVFPAFSLIDTVIILEYIFGSLCVLIFFILGFGYTDANYVASIQEGIQASNAPVDDNYRYSINNRITSADNALLPFNDYGSIAIFASNKPNTMTSRLGAVLGGDTVAYSGDSTQNYISDALLARKYIIDTNVDTSKIQKRFVDTAYRSEDLDMTMLTKEGSTYVNNYVLSRFYLTDSDYKLGDVASTNSILDQDKLLYAVTGQNSLHKLNLPMTMVVKKDGQVIDTSSDNTLDLELAKGKYEIEVTINSDDDYKTVYADDIYNETQIYSDRVKYSLNSFAIARSLDVNGAVIKKATPSEFSLKKGENKMVFKVSLKKAFDVARLKDAVIVSIDLSHMYVFDADELKESMTQYNDQFVVSSTILDDGSGVYELSVKKTDGEKAYIDSSIIYDKNFTVSDGYELINNEGFLRISKTDGSNFDTNDTFKLGYKMNHLSLVFAIWFGLLVITSGSLFFYKLKQ